MCHVNTKKSVRDLGLTKTKDREKLFGKLQEVVPAGLGKKSGTASDFVFRSASGDKQLDKKVEPFIYSQLATLGSGNHFLEIGENGAGEIGLTIHSGSRRVGYDIASWYIRKGRLLSMSAEWGQAYFTDMLWAQDFALENRRLMLRAALLAMRFSASEVKKLLSPDSLINESHNHAVRYGEDGILHRKGATPAEKGQFGVIPANQRDGVWVTRGLGNAEFLASASHGAGRRLSRKAAAQKGSVAEFGKMMQGVVCRTDKDVLDEAPWAYKKLDEVLAAQDGILVDVLDHFKPLVVLKG
jgi:tRNA-splicing ligase RtcB